MANFFPTLSILIVENHSDTLIYLQTYLEMKGYVVRSASTMEAALASLSSEEIDVLISDVNLPDGNGLELMRRLAHLNIFGISMSGYDSCYDFESSSDAGYKYHIVKPFLPEELESLLEKAPRRC